MGETAIFRLNFFEISNKRENHFQINLYIRIYLASLSCVLSTSALPRFKSRRHSIDKFRGELDPDSKGPTYYVIFRTFQFASTSSQPGYVTICCPPPPTNPLCRASAGAGKKAMNADLLTKRSRVSAVHLRELCVCCQM